MRVVQKTRKLQKQDIKSMHGAQARAQQQNNPFCGAHGVGARVAFLKFMLTKYIKTQYVGARRGSKGYINNILIELELYNYYCYN